MLLRAGSTTTQVKNLDDFNGQTLTSEKIIAKYPGTVGNSLKVSICPAVDSAFENWAYVSSFDAAPSTSDYVSSRSSATGDEVHMVVVDEDGVLTGSKGTVLETFPFVSLVSDAKTSDGSSNYALDALNDRSAYVWGGAIDFNTAPVFILGQCCWRRRS